MLIFKTNQNVRTSLEREFPVTKQWYFFQKTWIRRIGNYFFKFRFSLYVRRIIYSEKPFLKIVRDCCFSSFCSTRKNKKAYETTLSLPVWWYLPLVLKFNDGFEQILHSWLGNTLNNDVCTHAGNFLNFCRLFPILSFDIP